MPKPKVATTGGQKADTDYAAYGTEQRREYIIQLIRAYGIWNLNKSALAERFQVKRDTIYNDIERILPHISVIDADETTFEMNRALQLSTKHHFQVMNDPKASRADKAKSSEILLKCMDQADRFMQNHDLIQQPKPISTDVTFSDFVKAFKIQKQEASHEQAKDEIPNKSA